MKIALATDDRKYIARRTGRAAEFALFHIEDGKLVNVDYVKNTHTHHQDHEGDEHKNHGHHHSEGQHHGHHHSQGHSHKEIVDVLKGIDLFLVRHLGSHFKEEIIEAGIPFEMVKEELIEDLIKSYLY